MRNKILKVRKFVWHHNKWKPLRKKSETSSFENMIKIRQSVGDPAPFFNGSRLWLPLKKARLQLLGAVFINFSSSSSL